MSANPGSEPVFPTDAKQPSPESTIREALTEVLIEFRYTDKALAALSVLVAERDEEATLRRRAIDSLRSELARAEKAEANYLRAVDRCIAAEDERDRLRALLERIDAELETNTAAGSPTWLIDALAATTGSGDEQ